MYRSHKKGMKYFNIVLPTKYMLQRKCLHTPPSLSDQARAKLPTPKNRKNLIGIMYYTTYNRPGTNWQLDALVNKIGTNPLHNHITIAQSYWFIIQVKDKGSGCLFNANTCKLIITGKLMSKMQTIFLKAEKNQNKSPIAITCLH